MPSAASPRPRDATAPIIPGFHSDPTGCFVDGSWYVAFSSFEYFPAAPLYRSDDLTTWTPIGAVIDRPGQAGLAGAGDSQGIYGSTLRHHDGRFWFVTTNISRFGDGQLLFTTEDPSGPWSDSVLIPQAIGIDPDIAWSEDGSCLLTWCSVLGPDGMQIVQADLDPTTGALTSAIRPLWSGTGMRNPEGPHLFAVDDWWHLVIAEGGTDRGHSVSVARSRDPRGPFEPHPANPIFTHRSTDLPVQSIGHADLMEDGAGGHVMIYHGVRPAGAFPEYHVLGRETFAADVRFTDGWLEVTGPGPVAATPSPIDLDCDGGTLPPQFVSPGTEALPTPRNGRLPLRVDEHPRPIAVRVTALEWDATLQADPGTGATALLLRLDDRHQYRVEQTSDTVQARIRIGPAEVTLATADLPTDRTQPVRLVIRARRPQRGPGARAEGPDEVELGWSGDGGFQHLAAVDGRYVSTEVAGGFTGRMIGFQQLEGDGEILAFSFEPHDRAPGAASA